METYPMISIHSTASVADAAQLMADCSIGAVAVLDAKKQFIGIFTERDLANFVGRRGNANEVELAAVVNDFPVVVDGPISAGEAAEFMNRSHVRHLIVKEGDEFRIVSMRDLFSGRGAGASTDFRPRRRGPVGTTDPMTELRP